MNSGFRVKASSNIFYYSSVEEQVMTRAVFSVFDKDMLHGDEASPYNFPAYAKLTLSSDNGL